MKYLSLFSGIGAFEKAFKNLGIDYDLVGFSEIDKYATKSYCAVHNVDESKNLGDITKIDETTLPPVDLITYGFPCQDISLAGKQQGLFKEDGTQTRSGLFFDALRIIDHCKPMVCIAENVKNLTSKKFAKEFEIVLSSLEDAGYNNYWKVLNAKDFGIPQNRERVFIVSVRKDVDGVLLDEFEFPQGFPLDLRLKDMLEDEVDEKYYITDGNKIVTNTQNKEGCLQVGNLAGGKWDKIYESARRFYSTEGISPTIHTMQGGNTETKIITDKTICLNSKGGRNGVEGLQPSIQDRVYSSEGIAPAVTTCFRPNVTEKAPTFVDKKYQEFYDKNGYIPEMFNPYNCAEVKDIAPTQTTICGSTTGSATVLKAEKTICEQRTDEGLRFFKDDVCGALRTTNACGDKRVLEVERTPLKFLNRNQKNTDGDYAFCVDTTNTGGVKEHYDDATFRIRKLTPLECWRLMGFEDEDFYKAKEVPTSDSQLYKQAGNSIVVQVAEALLKQLII